MPITYGFQRGGANLTTELPEIQSFMAGFQKKPEPPPMSQNQRGMNSRGGQAHPYPVRDRLAEKVKLAQGNAAIQEAAARAAKAKALYEPPPMRPMIGGPGMITGPRSTKLDMAGLTGVQRDVFLPKESAFTDPRADAASEDIRKQTAAADFRRYIEDMKARGMNVQG